MHDEPTPIRHILHLTASPRGPAADSHTLSAAIVDALLARYPAARVTCRELWRDGPRHPDAAYAAALRNGTVAAARAGSLARSDALIAELEATDALVIGTPMHNLGVPSVLKAWIDHVARIHRTMRPTPQGKVGTLADRPVYLAIASGGWRSGPGARQPDFVEPYLRAVLQTMGLADITVFSLEATALAPQVALAARQDAFAAVARHFGRSREPL